MKKLLLYTISALFVLLIGASEMYAASGYTLTYTGSQCTTYLGPPYTYSQIVGHWSNYGGSCKMSSSYNGQGCKDSVTLVMYNNGCGPSCCCANWLQAAGSIVIYDNCEGPITSPGVSQGYPGFGVSGEGGDC